MREWMGQLGQQLLTITEKVYMESWVGTYNLVFCSGYNALTLLS